MESRTLAHNVKNKCFSQGGVFAPYRLKKRIIQLGSAQICFGEEPANDTVPFHFDKLIHLEW